MEGVTNATALGSFGASLRSVDMTPQSQKNQRLSAELASTPPGSPKSRSSQGLRERAAVAGLVETPEEAQEIRDKFRRRLVGRYHTTFAAWKQIDPQSLGRLSFFDFCRACRNMGCDGEARILWEALDQNADGFITLDEFDPSLAVLLEDFSRSLNAKNGTADKAWKEHFNKNGFGRCSAERFFKACERVGFQGNVGSVYDALDVDGPGTGIAFEDFQLLDKFFKTTSGTRWSYGQLRAVILPK